jgi:hypothetical protein
VEIIGAEDRLRVSLRLDALDYKRQDKHTKRTAKSRFVHSSLKRKRRIWRNSPSLARQRLVCKSFDIKVPFDPLIAWRPRG